MKTKEKELERIQNKEANRFAMELLMPEPLVKTWMEKHGQTGRATVRMFASDFGVDRGLAAARLFSLGYDIGCGS